MAEIDEPRTARNLALKMGGGAGKLVTADLIASAEKRLQLLAVEARTDIARRLDAMLGLYAQWQDGLARSLFDHAHNIRGVAGTFGMAELGEVCDALCRYLDDLPPGRMPDRALTHLLLQGLRGVLAAPHASVASTLARECQAAVRAVRQREGRTRDLE